MEQISLFSAPPLYPPGFSYAPEFITEKEEQELMAHFKDVSLHNYVHLEYAAKRRIHSYTSHTGYPDFLRGIIGRAATFAGEQYEHIEHAMITEYTPGTQIGWHRDMPPYNKVIGISLGSAAPFRLRKQTDTVWERITITAEPRSIYVMSGDARYVWQHSIPPVTALRYSITMRTIS
jgi:alkylated DNA repair dioxygenase AlkB